MRWAPPAVSNARPPAPSGPPAATLLNNCKYWVSSDASPQNASVDGPSLMLKPLVCEYVPAMLLQSALPVNVPSVLKTMV